MAYRMCSFERISNILKTGSVLKNLTPATVLKSFPRSVIILKRTHKLRMRSGRTLNPRKEQYEYEVVEDTHRRKKDPISVVLTEFVEDVGKRGEVVAVHPIFAHEKLLLFGRALYATPENVEKLKHLVVKEKEEHSTLTAFKTMKALNKKVLSLFMNMHNPWTIEPWHIRVAMRLEGVHILNDSSIQLPDKPIKGPDLSLEGKDFVVYITINNCEKSAVRCRLHHYTIIYSERIVLPPNHYCIPAEPIFQDQADLLASIPLPAWKDPS